MAVTVHRDDNGVTDSLIYNVNGGRSSTDTYVGTSDAFVHIRPVRNFENGWGWFAAKLGGVLGWTPQVRLNAANVWGGTSLSAAAWRMAWTYDLHGDQWFKFDNQSLASSVFTLTNNAAWTQNTVYVAAHPCFTYARMENRVAEWITSPFVRSPPALVTPYTIATLPAATDFVNRAIPSLPLRAFEVSDWSVSTPKRRVMVIVGQHANERFAYWNFEAFIDRLLSNDASATQVRKTTIFRVIPLVNPQGTWGGYVRSSPSAPGLDHNRDWLETPTPHLTVGLVREFFAQHPSQVYLDFHSRSYDSTGKSNLSTDPAEGGGLAGIYFDAVNARFPVEDYD